jgi:HTH-type transcriptional regulator / antitoxin HigA
MTLTFNLDRYKDLLSQYQPKLIKTEAENEQALMVIEKLMYTINRTPEQDELYELLVVLVERFEQNFYQIQQENNPLSMLLFLMDQQDIPSSALVGIFGSQLAVDDVLAGSSGIDRAQAKLLGDFFHVDSMLFV